MFRVRELFAIKPKPTQVVASAKLLLKIAYYLFLDEPSHHALLKCTYPLRTIKKKYSCNISKRLPAKQRSSAFHRAFSCNHYNHFFKNFISLSFCHGLPKCSVFVNYLQSKPSQHKKRRRQYYYWKWQIINFSKNHPIMLFYNVRTS